MLVSLKTADETLKSLFPLSNAWNKIYMDAEDQTSAMWLKRYELKMNLLKLDRTVRSNCFIEKITTKLFETI